MVARRTLLGATGAAAVLGPAGTAGHHQDRDQGWGRHRDRQLLVKGGRLLTMDPQVGELAGDLLIQGGRITALASRVHARGARIIDARGMIVLPGMVDNHRHLWGALLRGVASDQTFSQYLVRVLQGIAPRLTARDVYLGGVLGALEAIASGTTTVLDWNHGVHTREHAMSAVRALVDSGIRGVFGYGSLATLTDPDAPPTADDIDAVRRRLARNDLLDLAIATWSPRSATTPELMGRIEADIRLARELGVVATMHTAADTSESVAILAGRGLLGPHLHLIHSNLFTTEDFAAVAGAGGWVSSSPGAEQQMGFGPVPLRRILDGGLRPTLSVDVPIATSGSLISEAKILLQTQRMRDHAAAADRGETVGELITAAEMLPYLTSNAAASLGLADQIGSLTVGKRADVVLIDATDPSLAGVTDPAAAVVQYAHPGAVDTVLIGGRVAKRHGHLVDLGVDLPALRREARTAQRRLLNT